MRKGVEAFTPEAATLLKAHPFPGNVRELRNVVERAAILCLGSCVTPEVLQIDRPVGTQPLPDGDQQTAQASGPGLNVAQVEDLNLDALEREVIRDALRRCEGNQVQAARLLGLSRMALHRRMRHYKL